MILNFSPFFYFYHYTIWMKILILRFGRWWTLGMLRPGCISNSLSCNGEHFGLLAKWRFISSPDRTIKLKDDCSQFNKRKNLFANVIEKIRQYAKIFEIFITDSINIESRVPGIYEATEEFYANIAIQCVNTWICEVYTDFVQIHSIGGLCIL